MTIPLQVTFQDFPPSPAVEARIREEVAKLERYADWITRCRVVVSEPHRHRHKGRLFEVHIFMPLAGGGEVAVDRGNPEDGAHEDVYVAIRDAFQAAARQLRVHIRKKRDHAARQRREIVAESEGITVP